jgi:hypothetical protein
MATTPTPPTRRRPRWLLAGIAAGAILGAGIAVGLLVDTGDGQRQPAAHAPATAATSSPEPATTTPAAASSDGPTCEQFEDPFTGGYDLGMPAHEWAGRLLAELTGTPTVSGGMTELTYTLDLKKACLDPSRFSLSARLVGTAVYQVSPGNYTGG